MKASNRQHARICDHCGRPIRTDAKTHAASDGSVFHWECTEPAPSVHVEKFDLRPGDIVAVLCDHPLTADQCTRLRDAVRDQLQVERVVIMSGGLTLAIAHREQEA